MAQKQRAERWQTQGCELTLGLDCIQAAGFYIQLPMAVTAYWYIYSERRDQGLRVWRLPGLSGDYKRSRIGQCQVPFILRAQDPLSIPHPSLLLNLYDHKATIAATHNDTEERCKETGMELSVLRVLLSFAARTATKFPPPILCRSIWFAFSIPLLICLSHCLPPSYALIWEEITGEPCFSPETSFYSNLPCSCSMFKSQVFLSWNTDAKRWKTMIFSTQRLSFNSS